MLSKSSPIVVGGVFALSATLPEVKAVFKGYSNNGQNVTYDYCSLGHSLEVYEDAANNFNEVFGGYSVPMDAAMCPFHQNNLSYLRDSKQLSSWRQAKIGTNGRITCPICNKVFKSQDYYELHLKT